MKTSFTGPRAEDVASIDALVTAIYEIISGPAGPKDWDRERHLYRPHARLTPMYRNDDGTIHAEHLDVDEFCSSRGEFLEAQDFVEREIGRRVDRFGGLAHVWSAYEGVGGPPGGPHEVMFRGINSFQLEWDGERWWILSAAWYREDDDHPLPEELLAGIDPG
jgi:hypothetical protein